MSDSIEQYIASSSSPTRFRSRRSSPPSSRCSATWKRRCHSSRSPASGPNSWTRTGATSGSRASSAASRSSSAFSSSWPHAPDRRPIELAGFAVRATAVSATRARRQGPPYEPAHPARARDPCLTHAQQERRTCFPGAHPSIRCRFLHLSGARGERAEKSGTCLPPSRISPKLSTSPIDNALIRICADTSPDSPPPCYSASDLTISR